MSPESKHQQQQPQKSSRSAPGGSPTHSPGRPGADRRANKRSANPIHPSTEICQKLANRGASTVYGTGKPTKIHGRAAQAQRPRVWECVFLL